MKGRWTAPLSACGIGTALDVLRRRGLEDSAMVKPLEAGRMKDRAAKFPMERRAILVQVLKDQIGPQCSPVHRDLIDRLAQPDAVTLVAGHQLVTGMGPLYVHAKISETVALADYWTGRGIPSVPVFWMASEDHDLDEIRRIFWRGKPVGSWAKPEKPLRSGVVASEPAAEAVRSWREHAVLPEPVRIAAEFCEDAYRTSSNLAEATRTMIQHYHPGVLVLDASDARLKALAAELWDDEIRNQTLYSTANQASAPWEGAEPPVPFRPSALFALDGDGSRFRLDRNVDGSWVRSDGTLLGSDDDVAQWAAEHPHQVSPNALLRPIYQEWIMPNAAYTGGAGEMAYAYQLAVYWSVTGQPHGVWRLRHSGTWFTASARKARESWPDFAFSGPWNPQDLRNALLEQLGAPSRNVRPITQLLESVVTQHYGRPELSRSLQAWIQRMAREEDRMVERVRREVARQESVSMRRLATLTDQLLPSGVLQERIWTHFDLMECGGAESLAHYVEAYRTTPSWDEPGWWEFT